MKKIVLLLFIAASSLLSQAQISVLSETMQLKTDMTEWSEPVTVSILSTENNAKAVPVQFMIRFKKRVWRDCYYEVEVNNTSSTQAISFHVYNSWTDANGNFITYKIKLKPGESTTITMKYASNSNGYTACWPKEDEECRTCGWEINIYNIK